MDKDQRQMRTPFLTALKNYTDKNVSPFDVPGHHMGNVDNDFKDLIGANAYRLDVNAPRGLDNLFKSRGVIKEMTQLLSEAYGCDHSFVLVNGTTSGIIAMILASCQAKDKIIMPRNVHKSGINGLILSGAIPVFIKPVVDKRLEIANHVSFLDYKRAIDENPDAKAVFIINPTYFGVTTELEKIVSYAHEKDMICLVDEAHGAHFHFCSALPLGGIKAGADLVAGSFHKTAGSLTQSSVLLLKSKLINHYDIQKALSILVSTSPSSLFIASIDSARKYIYFNGEEDYKRIIEYANYARVEIDKIPGFYARGRDYFISLGAHDYDDSKVVIEVDNIDLTGFDVYNILFDQFQVQMELAETSALLAVFSLGTKMEHVNKLIEGLKWISEKYYVPDVKFEKIMVNVEFPLAFTRPRSAYHAPKKRIDLRLAEGEISKELIMIYPPGIPMVIPGEIITRDIIDRIYYYESKGATVLSDYDDESVNVIDKENWTHYEENDDIDEM